MAHLEIRKFIAARPESVWAVLEDVERQGEWMADVAALDVVSERKRGEGVVIRVTSRLFGLPVVRDEMEIVRWEAPWRMDVVHRGAFHGTGSFLLEPAHNGTIFTWVEDFEAPLGPLGEAAWAVAVRPHLLRVFGKSMENVRRLALERERGVPPDAATRAG